MGFDLNQFRKLETPSPAQVAKGASGRLTAIITVKVPGYRPKGVKVRSEADAEMFTAEFAAGQLKDLEKDPAIRSISISRKLQSHKK